MHKRLSVNINRECAAILRKTKAERGVSTTEAIRRAVAYLDLVERVTAAGGRLVVVSPDGTEW